MKAREPIPDSVVIWANSLYHGLGDEFGAVEDLEQLKESLVSIKSSLEKSVCSPPIQGVDRITLKKVIFQIPPYPSHPRPRPIFEGVVASLDGQGKFVSVMAVDRWDDETHQPYLQVESAGYRHPQFRFAYIRKKDRFGYIVDDIDPPKPLEVVQRGDRYYYQRRAEEKYWFIIYVNDASIGHEEHVYLR